MKAIVLTLTYTLATGLLFDKHALPVGMGTEQSKSCTGNCMPCRTQTHLRPNIVQVELRAGWMNLPVFHAGHYMFG